MNSEIQKKPVPPTRGPEQPFRCLDGHDSECLMSNVCAKQIPADPMAQGQGVCRGEAWRGCARD